MDYEALKPYVEETIPWVKASGLRAEVLENRHVVLRLPRDQHLNHVGIVYGDHGAALESLAAAWDLPVIRLGVDR